jgi:hypothetical protein
MALLGVAAAHGPERSAGCLPGLISREKLGIDPTLHASALDLDPVPLLACYFEARAFGCGPENSSVRGWCRSDIYARPLQENVVLVLPRRREGLNHRAAFTRCGRRKLG